VRYEACYSPGTDYVLRRRGTLVGVSGLETTSNYQLRYRDSLIVRGLWVPVATADLVADLAADRAAVVVRSVKRNDPAPDGWREIHRDLRFVAYTRATHR
ncbi:MAG: hypothetical protein ACRENJ_00705, partial [Candidatus Eiseniibacteriota bacterium]